MTFQVTEDTAKLAAPVIPLSFTVRRFYRLCVLKKKKKKSYYLFIAEDDEFLISRRIICMESGDLGRAGADNTFKKKKWRTKEHKQKVNTA